MEIRGDDVIPVEPLYAADGLRIRGLVPVGVGTADVVVVGPWGLATRSCGARPGAAPSQERGTTSTEGLEMPTVLMVVAAMLFTGPLLLMARDVDRRGRAWERHWPR